MMFLQKLQHAASIHQQGLLNEACPIYLSLLKEQPRDVNVLNLLGVLYFQRGDAMEGSKLLQKCLRLKPDFAEAHNNLGKGLLQAGKTADAVISIRRAVALDPNYTEAHLNLSEAYGKQRNYEGALRHVEIAIGQQPSLLSAWGNKSTLLEGQGQFAEALSASEQVLLLSPGFPSELLHRARLLGMLDRLPEAIEAYRLALQVAQADKNVVLELCELMLQSERADEALPILNHFLSIDSRVFRAVLMQGMCFQQMEYSDEAIASYSQALEIEPDNPTPRVLRAEIFHTQEKWSDAERELRQALAFAPEDPAAKCTLATILSEMGLYDESVKLNREVIERHPGFYPSISVLLLSHSYVSGSSVAECVEEARSYGRVVAASVPTPFVDWVVDYSPQRIRVGLVSGDFREHPVGFFLEDVLAQIDSRRIELYAYPTRRNTDPLSHRIQPCFSAWTSLGGMSDRAAAERIRADGIHVLIDLSGHTYGGRLPVFAHKPAPVQCSWLGYCATSGVAEIDYYLADQWALPPELEAQFIEKIWRLPSCYLCFSRPRTGVAVSELPATSHGYVTFGSFNNLTKLSSQTIAAWAKILMAVPNSRLLLKAKQLRDESARSHILAQFSQCGIESGRIQLLEFFSDRADHLAAYGQVDICLDAFPYNGVTTTVEALWMGVPVLTIAGDRFISRQGVSILTGIGLKEWVARDVSDLVEKAVALSGDLPGLIRTRAGLRALLGASPVLDSQGFARHFEDALWGMWRHYLDAARGGA
jgi:predicted O-linked N-acetylglucosamine transferase (SPINDLY family)